MAVSTQPAGSRLTTNSDRQPCLFAAFSGNILEQDLHAMGLGPDYCALDYPSSDTPPLAASDMAWRLPSPIAAPDA